MNKDEVLSLYEFGQRAKARRGLIGVMMRLLHRLGVKVAIAVEEVDPREVPG